jgi:alkylation response protein AidB-like acyl-CoA dehydrogenase
MATQLQTFAEPTSKPSPFDRAALKNRVQALLPQIAARAGQTERDRRVPAETMAELEEAGFFRLVKPAEFGGDEQDFDILAETIQQIGSSCASTAWVSGLLAAHQWLLASFPIEAQHDVWDAEPNALLCGSYAPAAKAEVVDNGYRLTGRWSFASGCDVSDWAFCAAMVPSGEGAPPRPAFLLVPRSDYRIDDDWNVVGLAGTGSKTLVLEAAFVPEHRLLFFSDTTAGTTPGARHYSDNPSFTVPMLSNIASCLASAGVGAAMGALENYIASVGSRTTRGAVAGGAAKMAEFPTIQIRVAEASASIDAARELLLRDLRRRNAVAREGRLATTEERIESRRGQAFAVKLALSATEALNASTGGQGLTLENPVQRAWRDVNAVGRHISFNWDAVGSMVGQSALGLEPKGQF